jgi:hypothetical protein
MTIDPKRVVPRSKPVATPFEITQGSYCNAQLQYDLVGLALPQPRGRNSLNGSLLAFYKKIRSYTRKCVKRAASTPLSHHKSTWLSFYR